VSIHLLLQAALGGGPLILAGATVLSSNHDCIVMSFLTMEMFA